jgi:hypothetical protein
LLPTEDPASGRLAAKFDMYPTDGPVLKGMQLYRCEL